MYVLSKNIYTNKSFSNERFIFFFVKKNLYNTWASFRNEEINAQRVETTIDTG